ncbi:hypothetical protein OG394_18765 [Kribbella sp. NBC_01245]|uniref:hypothetical protein n=1 Tax=Kribbella sp. NBC_01245 TaxID=2903578 RepID=UPI002E2C1CF3|nr:hypothetical protein [Kribbella sp. NBC_01245]
MWWIGVLVVMGGLVVVGAGAGALWRSVLAQEHAERKQLVSWWGTRNGWRYTRGSDELLGYLPAEPFGHGTSRDVQDLLQGRIAGRSALLVQFSWYYLPDAEQSSSVGTSGVRSGVRAAAVVELPGAVPALTVRREVAVDAVRGSDLEVESGRFNAAFRVVADDDRFAHAVVNPRLMAYLLDHEGFSVRLEGRALVVWRDGLVENGNELGALASYAAKVFELIPSFVYADFAADERGTPVSAIPADVLGDTPAGAVHFLQRLTHRGHEIERYEALIEQWKVETWTVVVKIAVPVVTWPTLSLPARVLAPSWITHFDDEVPTGDEAFDRRFVTGTARPDFAKAVLTPEVTSWLASDPRAERTRITFLTEYLDPAPAGTIRHLKQAALCVMADGRLSDQALADQLTDLACDLIERLPAAAYEQM